MDEIKPRTLDLDNTWIKVGCYRETDRLDRVLSTYQKALTLADNDGLASAFVEGVVSMHDHKGSLTIEWKHVKVGEELHHLIDKAWEDQGEHLVSHLAESGTFIAGERQ